MIITSHMQNNIQIHPCLLKLSRKQESVTDGRTDRQTAASTISLVVWQYCYAIKQYILKPYLPTYISLKGVVVDWVPITRKNKSFVPALSISPFLISIINK